MNESQLTCTVMFIDFVGSTRLYDLLGNVPANQIIDEIMSSVARQVREAGGCVIKTIGDEIMCRFDDASSAGQCACDIQRDMERQPSRQGFSIALRIGFHSGEALLMEDGDLYGDAVNVAARMAGLSRAGQIILSRETLDALDASLQTQVRILDEISVKGKQQPMTICQLIWEPNDATFMAADYNPLIDEEPNSDFVLHYQDQHYRINSDRPSFMFGRGEQCDLVIDADHVSRCHARVEYRRGKFVLIDQSTNGTFVTLGDGRELFLRRDEMTLWGDGVISIGASGDRAQRTCLYFNS